MDAISKEELNDYHYRIVRDDGKVNRYDLLVGLEYYFSRRFGKQKEKLKLNMVKNQMLFHGLFTQ